MATTKKFLQAAAGAAGGAAEVLPIEDVFSTYLYTGNGSSQDIQNNISLASIPAGSVYFDGSNDAEINIPNSVAFDLGSAYTVEAWIKRYNSSDLTIVGRWYDGSGTDGWVFHIFQGQLSFGTGNTYQDVGGNVPLNEWVHVAATFDGTTKRYFVNGTLTGSFTNGSNDTVTGGASTFITVGGNSTDSNYNQPMGIANLRVTKGQALYTSNFTPPSRNLSVTSNTSLLICQGPDYLVDASGTTTSGITINAGVTEDTLDGPSFFFSGEDEGGLVWIKERTGTRFHVFTDSERGVGSTLFANSAVAAELYDHVTSLNSNGFSVKDVEVNGSSQNYASWTFRKAPRFFDVVTYTGNGTTQDVAHNLGVIPGAIIVKSIDATYDWPVYHRGADATAPENYFLTLNSTGVASANGTAWNNTAPTDSVFTVGSGPLMNASGVNYVAYLFAHDPLGPSGDGSDGLIACGSYSDTSSVSVNLGWEPQWLLVKNANSASDWIIVDTMRGMSHTNWEGLRPNNSNAESGGATGYFKPTPTGFEGNAGFFGSSNIIYIAIRRGPMRVPTSGTEVFAPVARTGTGGETEVSTAFTPDFIFSKDRETTQVPVVFDRMRGDSKYLYTNYTFAEETNVDFLRLDRSDAYGLGFDGGINQSGRAFIDYVIARAPNFFDVVAYTGTGSTQAVSHNLTVAPEMIWVKQRNGTETWSVFNTFTDTTYKVLTLNSTSANTAAINYGSNYLASKPTASQFELFGDGAGQNTSSGTYIAYLFASLDGVSKVGSYTGNGTNQTIDCGFTSGARFVLIKRTSGASDWYVFDTARGIVSGTDPYLNINSSAAENQYGLLDFIDPDGSGFIADNNYAGTNQSGESYIFLAIA